MSTQQRFTQALLSAEQTVPAGLFSHPDAESRFAVYRNNVFSSLTSALADSYPVVAQLVGAEFFAFMARFFIQTYPPCSPVLVNYGNTFADFIDTFSPAASLPYLADMARLERLRVEAYHAADFPGVGLEALSRFLEYPEQLHQLHLKLHPGTGVLCSSSAVFSLWAAHQGQGELAEVDPDHAEQLLVLRDALNVEVLPLSKACALFIRALQGGAGFGGAVCTALEEDSAFDAGPALALLIQKNLIIHAGLSEAS
ncbi:DUF2063 domain-containing protein [Pseudomonas sp. HLS-6]|uniref:HvfC/BufC N-terminal domain-containing protein n=1 Tax=Pseudomonas sp. HLS-6 TaxID=2049589 RepID=UPI000C1954FE|nr:DNA-binding domain-containing protein [Pseudomonas sp. HLS-6]ATR84430.1 DUF2063 domain-containing protein [Pseudomonas sp. HLS-6]